MLLHYRVLGSGPRVVLVHGFTQTGASWRVVAEDLAVDHEVVVVDAPGHGGSSGLDLDLAAGAAALDDTCGPAVYVGYSMGGRLCLRLGLDRPGDAEALVLIGATAGIDDDAERATRRRADDALADELEATGVGPFLDRWLAQPLFAGVPDDPAERASRATNTAAGLAASLRLAGTGTMDPPWWPELGHLRMPVTLVAGERDAKFRALARRLADEIAGPAGLGSGERPRPEVVLVPGSGHAVPLEAPAATARLIRAAVARARSPR